MEGGFCAGYEGGVADFVEEVGWGGGVFCFVVHMRGSRAMNLEANHQKRTGYDQVCTLFAPRDSKHHLERQTR